MAANVTEHGRSARLEYGSITCVPAEQHLRCLRDWLIVEPLDTVHSTRIFVSSNSRPLRGIVHAVGPGCYPKRYDHSDKGRRTKTWDSTAFRPTQVRRGDMVELGGADIGGYAFQTFYWGSKLCLWAREEDVCLIIEDEHVAA